MFPQYRNNQHLLLQTASYSVEALALFARMTTPPDTARKTAINALIASLKVGSVSGSNIWGKLDVLYVLAAADAQAAGLNWVADAFNITVTGVPVFTPDRGYAGTGAASTDTLGTGFDPTTAVAPKYVRDDAHIGVWSRTATQDDVNSIVSAGGAAISMTVRSTGDKCSIKVNNTILCQGASLSGIGHFIGTRTGSAAELLYINGVNVAVTSRASVAVIAGSIGILGTPATVSCPKEHAAAHIGSQLSANEALDTYNALQAYMTAVGA